MGVSMFIQQKMTPSTADPVQQKVMLIMPLMMTDVLWSAERPGDLLDGQQRLGHRRSSRHQPLDWPDGRRGRCGRRRSGG